MLSVTGKNQIGYSVSGEGNQFFYGINPRTNEPINIAFHGATESEVQRALVLAKKAAFEFKSWSPKKRMELLEAIAQSIETHRQVLIDSFLEESGLPLDRANQELARSCYQFRSYGEAVVSGLVLDAVIESGDPNRSPSPKPELRRINIALGPVVVFGASNFPFAYSTIGGDVASALAAGCPVIVKAHPMHPKTSSLCATVIAETLQSFGCPEGLFSHLLSADHELGRRLVLAPEVKAVGFTGSIRGGRALMDLAASRKEPIPVFAEMGSVNPIIVLPKAMVAHGKEIASKIAASVALNAGQFCTSPGLLFVVENDTVNEFLDEIGSQLDQFPAQWMLHSGIYQPYVAKVEQRAASLKVLRPGTRSKNCITPAMHEVGSAEFIRNPELTEEVFGSYLLVVRCASQEELLKAIEVLEGQLTGSIFCEKDEKPEWWELLQTKVGRIIINGVPTGVEVSFAQQHGGPYPSSSMVSTTSVGPMAIKRFMRPLVFQNCPDELLPDALKKCNPFGILRFVNGTYCVDAC